MPFFPPFFFFSFLSQTDPSQPFALLGCAPGTPRRCINLESPGPPMVVPAFSWNSLIHQHSYEISFRRTFFIGCDKNPGSGGSRIGAWMSGNQNHPFWGCFSFLFRYGRQIPNHQLPGSTKTFASSLIFPVEPSHFHSMYPLLFSGTPPICAFPSYFLFFLLPKKWIHPSLSSIGQLGADTDPISSRSCCKYPIVGLNPMSSQ